MSESGERWEMGRIKPVSTLPNPQGVQVKFEEVKEGELCYVYGDRGACYCYKKVHPQDDGSTHTQVNAFLMEEPGLTVGRKVWISQSSKVFLRNHNNETQGDPYDCPGA